MFSPRPAHAKIGESNLTNESSTSITFIMSSLGCLAGTQLASLLYIISTNRETVTANAKNAKSPRHLLAGKKEISPRSRSDHIQIPTRRSSRWQEGDLAEIRIRSYPDPNKKIFSLARRRSCRDPDQIISRSQQEDLLAGKKEISPKSGSDHIQIPARRSSCWQEGDLVEIQIQT